MSGWNPFRKTAPVVRDPEGEPLSARHLIGLPGLDFDELVSAQLQREEGQLRITRLRRGRDVFILRLSQLQRVALLDTELDVVKANSPIAHGMLWGLAGGRNSDMLAAMTWRPTRTEKEMRRGLIWIEYRGGGATHEKQVTVLYPADREAGERFAEALCRAAGIDRPEVLRPQEGPTTTYL